MSCENFDELMREPPGGHNHGRKRGQGGEWISFEEELAAAYEDHLTIDPEEHAYHRPVKPADTIRHGTASAYQHDCRKRPQGACDACRAAWAEYKRHRRRVRRDL